MYSICEVVATTLDPRQPSASFRKAQGISDVKAISQLALPRLQSKDRCRTIQDRLEYLALRIHQTFTCTHLAQLAIQDCFERGLRLERDRFARECKSSCIQTLQAFLDMQLMSVIPLRSWVLLHHALSSALILGLRGIDHDSEAKKIQESALLVFSHLEEDYLDNDTADIAADTFSSRFPRALEELRKMSEDLPLGELQYETEGTETSNVRQTAPQNSGMGTQKYEPPSPSDYYSILIAAIGQVEYLHLRRDLFPRHFLIPQSCGTCISLVSDNALQQSLMITCC